MTPTLSQTPFMSCLSLGSDQNGVMQQQLACSATHSQSADSGISSVNVPDSKCTYLPQLYGTNSTSGPSSKALGFIATWQHGLDAPTDNKNITLLSCEGIKSDASLNATIPEVNNALFHCSADVPVISPPQLQTSTTNSAPECRVALVNQEETVLLKTLTVSQEAASNLHFSTALPGLSDAALPLLTSPEPIDGKHALGQDGAALATCS